MHTRLFEQSRDQLAEKVIALQSKLDAAERRNKDLAEKIAWADENLRFLEFFQRLFEKVPVLLVIWDARLRRFTLNRHVEAVLGWTRSEANAENFMRKVFPDADSRADVSEYMQSLQSGWRELKSTARDGSVVPVSWAGIRLTDDTMVGIGLDLRESKKAEAASPESEKNLRAYVTVSPDVVYTMSPDWEEMRSLQGHEFIPDTEGPSSSWLEKYIHPDDQPPMWSAINEAIRTKSVFELEHRVIRVDGTLGWTHSRAVPLLDENNEVVEWIGSAKDVTRRKATEEALQESNTLLSAILEQMPFGLGVLGCDGQTILANRTMHSLIPTVMPSRDPERRYRWRSVDAQGLLIPPERWPGARALAGESVSPGMQFIYTEDDGTESYMQVSAVPFRSAAGTIAGAIMIAQDITERKQVEETLRRKEEEFKALVENAPDVISLFDRNLRRIYVNSHIRENTDQDASFMMGKSLTEAGYPDSFSQPLNAALRKVFTTGCEEAVELDWEAPKGHIWLQIRCAPLRTADGSVERVMSIGRDITDRKQAEEALKLTQTSVDVAAEMIAWFTPDGKILYVNDATCRSLGYSRDELLNMTVFDISPDFTRERHEQTWKEVRHRKALTLQVTHRRKDGSRYPAEITVNYVRYGGREYRFTYGMDITERKRAEVALHRSNERSDLLAKVAQRLLAAENPQAIVEDLCRMVMEHIDCQYFFNYLVDVPEQRMALNAFAGIPDESAETIRKLDFGVAVCGCAALNKKRIIAEHIDASDDITTRLVKSFGVQAYCCHPLLIEEELLGTLSFGTRTRPAFTHEEISLMKTVADHVALAMHRLFSRKALRESEERLRASLAEKEVLLKEIHHRVKNNMQVVSSMVDLQANEVTDPAMHEVFKDVIYRVRSMALVHEKLYQSTDLARVDLADYAQSLLGYLWRAQGGIDKGIQLDLKLDPVLLPVNAAVPCGLILNELFSNALKHGFNGRDGGLVTVSLNENDHGEICLGVEDNGTGMPRDVDWKEAESLGLRLVRMLARQLHAVVEAKSDRGTTFTIIFKGQN